MELIFKDEVYAIVGAAIEAHRVLGPGFLEPVYQEAMEIESVERQLPFVAQPVLQIRYKEHTYLLNKSGRGVLGDGVAIPQHPTSPLLFEKLRTYVEKRICA